MKDESDAPLGKRLHAALPRVLLPPALLVALHGVVSLGFDGYDQIPVLDIPMHVAGGVVITLSGAVLLRIALDGGWIGSLHPLLGAVILVCFATTAAVVWEFVEFLADRYFDAGAQKSLADTLSDVLFGMLGSAPTAFLAARRLPGA